MLGFAWLPLRQAQEALKNGRLEEAHRLLSEPSAQGHKGSWELLQQLAAGFVARGERHLGASDHAAAWTDLLQAEQVGTPNEAAARLRQALTRQGLAEVRALLEAGETTRAGELAVQLRNRAVRSADLDLLDEVAKSWSQAREQANRGEFTQAAQALERARRLWSGPLPALDDFARDIERRSRDFTSVLLRLHEAVGQQRWRDVVLQAEQVLAVAPQHEEARRARNRAWKAIEPATIAAEPRKEESRPPAPPGPPPSPRFLLWIDGVGGYLVCLGNRVTLGQATPDAGVDIPLFADVSRLHASLTRDSEGYLLEATRSAQVNGKSVERALLQSGDRVTLGHSCQLQFRQPVPVSASARLDIVSGHRLSVAVDAVLLMADTLVLGPGSHVHVAMPDLTHSVVLFRTRDGLGIRHPGGFLVDGQPCTERGTLLPTSTVKAEEFTLAVEPLGSRMGRT